MTAVLDSVCVYVDWTDKLQCEGERKSSFTLQVVANINEILLTTEHSNGTFA